MQDLLDSIQQYKINDEICAQAYETCDPLLRSCIKTAIAFHFSQTRSTKNQECFTEKNNSGFSLGKKNSPIPYVFLIIDNAYSAPAQFLAVLCLAILSDVQNIFVFLDKNIPKEQFNTYITCLELCGIENSYTLPDEKILFALQNKFNKFFHAEGKHILFSSKNNYYPKLGTKNTYKENCLVTLNAYNSQKHLLQLAYGQNASIIFFDENATDCKKVHNSARKEFYSITEAQEILTDISFIPQKPAKQNYGYGMEFCYLCSKLPQNFFSHTIFFANLDTNYPESE